MPSRCAPPTVPAPRLTRRSPSRSSASSGWCSRRRRFDRRHERPGENWGGRNFLGVSRGYSVNTQHSLLRFDLSGIPSNTIVSATLRLTTAANGHNPAQNQQVAAYLLADAGDGWIEGDNAGWNDKDTTLAWTGLAVRPTAPASAR